PDPWAEFEREVAHLVPDGPATVPVVEADDPFGEWGFQSTFGPGTPGGGLGAGDPQPATDLQSFLRGLGVEEQGSFTRGELEVIGRATRIALQGLLQAAQAAASAREELRSEDRIVAEPREVNPLRTDSSVETKLRYL